MPNNLKTLSISDIHARPDNIEKVKKAFDFLNETAHDRSPDMILIPGDIWDGDVAVRYDSPLYTVVDSIRTLAENWPVHILSGTPSHDRYGSTTIFGKLTTKHPISVYNTPQSLFCVNPNGPNYMIMPVPGLTKSGMRQWAMNKNLNMSSDQVEQEISGLVTNMLLGFRAQLEKAREKYPNIIPILMGHFTVTGCQTPTGQTLTGGDICISAADLKRAGAVFNCLGHIHKAQIIDENIFYVGDPFGKNFGEKDPKSILWAELSPTGIVNFEQILTPFPAMVDLNFQYIGDIDEIELLTGPDEDPGLNIGKYLQVANGSEVRIRLNVDKDHAALATEDKVKALLVEAGVEPKLIKFEKIIQSTARQRSTEISTVTTNTDRLKTWALTTETEVPDSAIKKLGTIEEELKWSEQVNYSESVDISIKYLKLRGCGGIKWADEIEIDFTKFADGDIILLDGDNAAGKSFTLDNIGPWPFFPHDEISKSGKKGINWIAKMSDYFRLPDSYRELIYEINGKDYRFLINVDSEREKAEYYAFEFKNGEWDPLNDGKKPSYKEEILKLFGDPELYLQAAYQVQGYDGLVKKTNAELKELFYELLGFDKYRLISESAKEELKNRSEEIKLSESEIEKSKPDLDKIPEIENDISEIENDIKVSNEALADYNRGKDTEQEKLTDLQDKIALQDSNRKQLREVNDQIDRLSAEQLTANSKFNDWLPKQSKKISDLKTQIEADGKLIDDRDHILEMAAAQVEYKTLSEQDNQFRARGVELSKELEQLTKLFKSKKESIEGEIKSLKNDLEWKNKLSEKLTQVPCQDDSMDSPVKDKCSECPLITESVSARDKIPEIQQQISDKEERLVMLESKYELDHGELRGKRADFEERAIEHSKKLNEFSDEVKNTNWAERKSQVEIASAKQEELEKQLNEASNNLTDQKIKFNETITRIETQLDELRKKKTSLAADIDSELHSQAEAIKSKIADIDKKIKNTNDEILSSERTKAAREQALEELRKLKKRIDELNQRLKGLKSDFADYSLIQRAFGRDGIPALLLENALPEISEITNLMLSEFDINRLVRFDTNKELASKDGQAEIFQITVLADDDKDKDRPLHSLSGGEKPPYLLAIQSAISTYRSRNGGYNYRDVIVDEIDGAMRAYRAGFLIQALQRRIELNGLKRLLLVTHRPELGEQIQQKIIFDQEAGKLVEVL